MNRADFFEFLGTELEEKVPLSKSVIPCANRAFDKANPDQVGKPRFLSCPCPRCSPISF